MTLNVAVPTMFQSYHCGYQFSVGQRFDWVKIGLLSLNEDLFDPVKWQQ